ncbi:unnamed protein product [Adineta steineri]|uniref:Uncharacterized protein n=1 Tax=Adineta steineri TaxID=433720 RepID=A0A813X047_9BILA|nr:unnamed protein product [Adineta steineri]CAF1243234.1 unnamed protein product [Adineta steineri]
MTTVINQPNLTEGLSLIGWRLKRDAEIQERKNDANFECEVEPSSTSYAAFEYMSVTDDDYNPYSGINIDLCLEVDAIDLNNSSQETNDDDYDPHEVFMRLNTRRTVTGRDRAPLALLPSQSITSSSLVNNYRNYNFADDDTPVKYPLAIGLVDRRLKPQNNIRGGYTNRPSFDSRSGVSSTIHPRQNNLSGIRRPLPPSLSSSSRQYPLNSSLKRVTFRQSDDDLDIDEDDVDNYDNDLRRRNKLPKRTAARIAVQRFRTNNHRSSLIDDDLDDDIAPTVTEMDMLEDEEDDEPIRKSMSSPVKPLPLSQNKPTGSKSSYIGNMLPSFYEQLPESKKMLLQDATVDSSSNQIDNLTKNSTEVPGGEEIIDEENRLQFRNTTPIQGYKRANNLQSTKRYYENDDDDDQQQQQQHSLKKRNYDYINRNTQYRYRRNEDDEEYDINQDTQQQQQQQEDEYQQTIRVPARRGRPPSQQHQEDPLKKNARIIAQFEEQHNLKLGEMRVYAPKLRLRISSVNVNWINLPPIPKYPNKVHQS